MSISPDYIDKPKQLIDLCNQLRDAPWLALDTEFLREKTYYPLFCLLQIATPDRTVCIDPIALPSLQPLLEIIYDTTIVKVFHSCRQDMEVLFQHAGRLPKPIFDTQIAAPYLGYAENMGYANLINELLGVQLSKTLTRTDWSKRPLSQEQLRYAADDVLYLGQAYRFLYDQLEKLERLSWLDAEFNELTQAALYENPAELAWHRISGAQYLKSAELSILQSLANWRETTAKHENIPRGWLIKDDILIDLAKRQPTELTDLKNLRMLNERIVKQYGQTLCAIMLEAQKQSPMPMEIKKRPTKKTAEQEALFIALQDRVKLKALQNKINPNTLATKKDIERLMNQDKQARLLQGWRKALIGDELIKLIQNHATPQNTEK